MDYDRDDDERDLPTLGIRAKAVIASLAESGSLDTYAADTLEELLAEYLSRRPRLRRTREAQP